MLLDCILRARPFAQTFSSFFSKQSNKTKETIMGAFLSRTAMESSESTIYRDSSDSPTGIKIFEDPRCPAVEYFLQLPFLQTASDSKLALFSSTGSEVITRQHGLTNKLASAGLKTSFLATCHQLGSCLGAMTLASFDSSR